MDKIDIELPHELADEFERYRDRLREIIFLGVLQLRIQEALSLYSRGAVSFARAAEIAGIPQQDLVRQARGYGIEPHWSEEIVQTELA
jgi:hypothetical protein